MSLNEGTEGTGGPSLSAEEEAFFTSGGESEIPAGGEGGADAGGGTGGQEGAAAKSGEGTDKKPDAAAPKNDHIPLATFLEEKKARKGLETQLQEAQRQIAEFTGKFAILDKLKLGGEQQQQPPAGPPAVEDDIFGAVKHVSETLAQMQKREADEKANREASEKAAVEQKTFVDNYRKSCDEFSATTTDFKAAYDFLLNSRAAELRAIGYETPETLHQALIADEFAIAQMAMEKGKSPAELIYNLANQRGYKKADAAASPSGDAAKAAAEKLDTIERGQAANKSLSSTGGSSGDQDMTAEALMSMSLEEFEAWTEKNPAKAKRLMGG